MHNNPYRDLRTKSIMRPNGHSRLVREKALVESKAELGSNKENLGFEHLKTLLNLSSEYGERTAQLPSYQNYQDLNIHLYQETTQGEHWSEEQPW